MHEKEVMKAKALLNRAKLYGCQDILCGDALHYPITYYEANKGNKRTPFIQFLRIVKISLFKHYDIKRKGTPKTLFLASISYGGRTDLCEGLSKVTAYENNYLYMEPYRAIKISMKGIKELAKPFIWNFQLRKILKKRRFRWYCIAELYQASFDYALFRTICRKKKYTIKNLVCLCDVHCVDSFFTQKFNAKGMTTVTLQHGTMVANANTWAFTGSKSRYFLAQGDFTVDEGKIAGYPAAGNMIPVGLISYVGQEEKCMPKVHSIKTIGVVMNGEDGEHCKETNIAIIKLINEYRKKYQRKVIVKFHPTSSITDYEKYMEGDLRKYCYCKEITMLDFIHMSDAAVVWGSTGMIEMLKSWKPVMTIQTRETADDIYKNVELPRFRNEDELEAMLEEFGDAKSLTKLSRLRDYFCTSGNTTKNYINTLKRIGIG